MAEYSSYLHHKGRKVSKQENLTSTR